MNRKTEIAIFMNRTVAIPGFIKKTFALATQLKKPLLYSGINSAWWLIHEQKAMSWLC
jgi:hypothetical protein